MDMREDTFTCDTLTLDPSEYYPIQKKDRVGACLRPDGDTEYLDILRYRSRERVHSWTGGGSCTEADMEISPTIRISNRQNAQLHLDVDINIDECAVGVHNCHRDATCSDIVGADGSFQCSCNTGYSGDGILMSVQLTWTIVQSRLHVLILRGATAVTVILGILEMAQNASM
ncbi:hypothetical protein GBAR_LOCUS1166 [Geodia barretti]|uniref:EGF-like domain-containing protein n=1 Tax=Geodia barretti TaxID=519541 RepID=A0AA35QVQ9_GEOBA|nr:hypothetical protein GBAR_LOCUS1166 [Geodia barretti]